MLNKFSTVNLKLSFNFLKKKKILFLNCQDIKNYCSYYKKDLIFINLREVNIFVLIKSLIQFIFDRKKNFKELYLNCLIKKISPEIIVQNDLNIINYNFKNNFPNIYHVIYQFGLIRNKKKYLYLKEIVNCDLFLSSSRQDINIQKIFFKSKFIPFGFARSNLVKKISKKEKIISFVSEYYRTKPKKEKNYEAKLLKSLAKVCKLRNLSLFIIKRSNRKDKNLDTAEEINYFSNILGNEFKYGNSNPYNVGDRALINVSQNSNLGLEFVSRKNKTIIFSSREFIKKKGFPLHINQKTPFFAYYSKNFNQIEKQILYILDLSNKKFIKDSKKYCKIENYKFCKNFPKFLLKLKKKHENSSYNSH